MGHIEAIRLLDGEKVKTLCGGTLCFWKKSNSAIEAMRIDPLGRLVVVIKE